MQQPISKPSKIALQIGMSFDESMEESMLPSIGIKWRKGYIKEDGGIVYTTRKIMLPPGKRHKNYEEALAYIQKKIDETVIIKLSDEYEKSTFRKLLDFLKI